MRDLQFAIRSLRRQPAFALLAVATLALGIGANAAIFSVVDAVLLRPLAYPHADRIVSLTNRWLKTGRTTSAVSGPDFHDWHDPTTSFDAMGYYAFGETSVSVGGAAEYATVAVVTPEFFGVFERPALIGRTLSRVDAQPGAPVAAVISDDFWQRHFSGRTDLAGLTLDFALRSVPIVGVMPPGSNIPDGASVWISASAIPETTSRSAHNYRVLARLKPGVSVDAAQAELSTLAARLAAEYPQSNEGKGAAVIPLRERLVGGTRPTLYLLFGAVALVLLIACANVANLLLARATARTSELAVRAAIGASRARLVAQLMTESALLAFLAAAVGLVIARWGIAAFVALAPAELPRVGEIAIDWRVVAFTLIASIAASIFFGVVPALQASRLDVITSLRQGGRGGALGGGSGRVRNALVVSEIALAVALVAGAALLVRSLIALSRVDLGFATEQRLVVETNVPHNDVADARLATATYAEILRRLEAIPGVVSIAGIRGLPGTAEHSNGGYWLEGGPGPDATGVHAPQAVFTVVTPNYFRTMAIPMRSGRDFTDRDTYDAPRVAIVNEALARQAFPGGDAIGHRIMCGLDELRFMTIVGIVGNVREYDPSMPPQPELYMPYQQHPTYGSSLRLVALTSVEPLSLANAFRATIRGVDVQVPVRATSMTATMSSAVATPRFRALLVGTFAALALVLAIAGVYGVMAYAVGRRRSEIGVRMAMGAAASDVLRLVMGQGLRLAAIGIAIGCALAYAVAQLLRGLLFGVGPADPVVFVVVPIALLVTAAAATAFPALRAARIDPIDALRAE